MPANIPGHELMAHPGLAGTGALVLVCLTDRRSARGAASLIAADCRDVTVLRVGMKAWTAAGLPVPHGALDTGGAPTEAPT